MRIFTTYKKEISIFLILAFFHGFVFEAVASISRQTPLHPSLNTPYYLATTIEEEIEQNEEFDEARSMEYLIDEEQEAALSSEKLEIIESLEEKTEITKGSTTTLYPSDMAYGEIGKSGRNAFDAPDDNLFKVEIKDVIDINANYTLTYEVYGIGNAAGVTKSINTNTSVGGFFIEKNEEWTRVTEYVSPYSLREGVNTILFTSDLNTDFGYLIRNLQIEKEEGTQTDLIHINDAVKKTEANEIYVQGVLNTNDPELQLFIDGREVVISNSGFEEKLKLDLEEATEVALEIKKNAVVLERKSVSVSDMMEVKHNKALDHAFNTSSYAVNVKEEQYYELKNVAITLPAESYAENFTLSIQELRSSDYAPTGMALKNATVNKAAYRFLPDGILFEKEATIKIKYDLSVLPTGYSAKDIQVFYFDTNLKQWTKVKVIDVIEESNEVVAVTSHFTDYIAGVIQEPESPEGNAFAPTTIRGIQAANPTENISMVSVPQINDRGDAALSFPLKLPIARKGMVPDLSVNYNSSADEGDFGLGWSLSGSTIEVDTRWGVPVFDSSKETESYLFNGEELLLVKSDKTLYAPHKDPLVNRVSIAKFQKMQHDPNIEITRSNGNWMVQNVKTGSKHYYEEFLTGKWYLTEVIDPFNNQMLYTYTFNASNNQHELSRIRYNVDKNYSNAPYSYGEFVVYITRKKTIDSPAKQRMDIKINNRTGADNPIKSIDLIDKIRIYSQPSDADLSHNRNSAVEYQFKYKEGQFGRSLLHKIIESSFNNNGEEIGDYGNLSNFTPLVQEYVFDYYDDVGTGGLFETTGKTINTFKDYETSHENLGVHISALGGGEGKSTNFSGGASIGLVTPIFPNSFLPFSRSATFGRNLGGGNSNSETKVLMADIDGDGLPDKIFKGSDNFYYRKNLGGSFSSDVYTIKKLPGLSYAKSDSSDDSFTVNILVGSLTKSYTESVSSTSTYTADVNADGLLDVVVNERVHFGYIDPVTKLPTFSLDSSVTPAIIVKEDEVAPILNPMPDLELTNGLMDVVMVWRAPKNGEVRITGTINKQHIALQSGVKFSIEKLHETNMGNASFVYGPHLMLSSSDSHDNTVNVVKGDLLFFRVHSNQMPVQELGVTWNPKVTYTGPNLDPVMSSSRHSSSYQEGFIVGINNEHVFKKKGKFRLEWNSFNLYDKDRITIKVSHFKKDLDQGGNIPVSGSSMVIYEKTSGIETLSSFPSPNIVLDMSTVNSTPSNFQYLKVEVLSDSEIDWKAIDTQFKPKLVSLDNQNTDVHLISYYSNYSKVHIANPPLRFVSSGAKFTVTLNNNFVLPACTQDICNDRYIYATAKFDNGSIVKLVNSSTNAPVGFLKFRYKIAANGSVIQKQRLNENYIYVNVGNTDSFNTTSSIGRKFYFEYYSPEYSLAQKLDTYQNTGTNYLVRIQGPTPYANHATNVDNNGRVQASIYSSEMNTAWGAMFRNWGQFAYKGAEPGEAYLPIKGEYIHVFNPDKTTNSGQTTNDVLSDTNATLEDIETNIDDLEELAGNVSKYFAVLMVNKKLNRWESHDHLYVSETSISPYVRFLTDDIPNLKPPTVPVHNYGAAGISKFSKVKNASTNKSFGFLMLNVGNTKTEGNSQLLNEFMDINGDGFPDIIGSRTQLTARRGGLSNRIMNFNFNTSTKINGSGSLVGGGSAGIKLSAPLALNTKASEMNMVVGNQGSGSLSGNSFNTTNEAGRFYVDINGDGLIDIVEGNGSILLNYGGTFAPYSGGAWGALPKQASTTQTKGGGAGGGFSAISNMDISAGVSASHSISKDLVTYMDLNGDGLPEKIVDGTSYYINLGTRFDSTAKALPGTQTQKSTEAGLNGNITLCYYFPVPILFTGPKFCGSIGGATGKSYSSEESRYMDFDGDGNIDYVTSTKNESVTVYPSRVRRTNLLKKVTQSTGATIELDYHVTNPIEKKPIGATYKMPYKKWALTKVTVFDGFIGDGENYTRYAYEYFNGYKDRKERSFLGFGETRAHLLNKDNIPYRTSVTEYLNNDMTDAQLYRPGISSDLKQFLYKKGLTKRTYTLDRTKRMLNESLYTYKFYDSAKVLGDLNTTTNLSSEVSVYTDKLSVLPLVTSIINRVTSFDEEVQNSSLTKETSQKFNLYDKFGNVKKYLDINRGITVDIEYKYGIKILPTSHRVGSTSGNHMLRMTKAFSNDGVLVDEIRKYETSTKFHKYNFEYDRYGNLTKKIFPEQNGTRYFYEYIYGDDFSHANDEVVDYNYRRMAPAIILDPFGNEMKMTYNASGLVTKVIDFYGEEMTYKYDQLNRLLEVKGPYELNWTIQNEYPSNRVAISKHNLGQGNVLHTSMINDGLGRTVQVKKEALPSEGSSMCGGQLPGVRLAVSGDVVYDEFGRVVENYLSEEELSCINSTPLDVLLRTYYNGSRTPEKRINRIYDQQDRVVEELVFGTNATTKTKYSFGLDKYSAQQFTQEITLPEGNKSTTYINDLGLTTSQKQHGNGDLWIGYVYDNLGQVMSVESELDQLVHYQYDNLGRTTSKYSTVSGNTVFEYDDLGNIVKKADQNGTIIKYEYDFNRLTRINEPSIETTFFYDFGGRLERMVDLSGSQDFVYGKLGEVVEDLKTIIDEGGVSRYFKTKYKYDSWGRILEMVYPDNEKLDYVYNRVGQLTAIHSNHFNSYLKDVKYTHFDQPYYVKYGNDVEMRQEFDVTERLRAAQLNSPDPIHPNVSHVFSRSIYNFDKNNNIISQSNDFSQHQSLNVGGTSQRVHNYDEFNRLVHSQGNWDGYYEQHDYLLDMTYNEDHSIASKIQMHYYTDKFSGQGRHSDHSLNRNYVYGDPGNARLTGINGISNDGHPIENSYQYYPNGNIAAILQAYPLPTTGLHSHEKEFLWDANNNITDIIDNGGEMRNQYIYDGKGERVAKRLLASNGVTINGGNPQIGMYGTDEMLYPSGNLSYSHHIYTKHYYANNKRIASSIENSSYGAHFIDPYFNVEETSPHEGLMQNSMMVQNASLPFVEDGGLAFPSSPVAEAICKNQIDILLNILYNSPEKIDCKNTILGIVERHTTTLFRYCIKFGIGEPAPCLEWSAGGIFVNYCAALEEINTLVCIERTADGKIIDPETGYVYDPFTGLPYDPITGEPIDMGLDSGSGNQLQIDCYNEFLAFLDFYQDKPNKPAIYDDLLLYLQCFDFYNEFCFDLPGVKLKVDEHGLSYFEVDWCSMNIPDLPIEPEEPVIPVFPVIILTPGVDDTWGDNPPAHTTAPNPNPAPQTPIWWYHSDHLGSSSYITDILGKPVQYYEYLPFGEIMVQQSTNNIFENVYKFNGKELDEQTGYYYYGARYYDPGASIWLSVDPLAEQFPNWNPYHYVHNNPINLIDPTGMSAQVNSNFGGPQSIGFTKTLFVPVVNSVVNSINSLREKGMGGAVLHGSSASGSGDQSLARRAPQNYTPDTWDVSGFVEVAASAFGPSSPKISRRPGVSSLSKFGAGLIDGKKVADVGISSDKVVDRVNELMREPQKTIVVGEEVSHTFNHDNGEYQGFTESRRPVEFNGNTTENERSLDSLKIKNEHRNSVKQAYESESR